MKSIRKNIYAVGVIILFVIAAAMLTLFLALFSSSTSVDGTTVGSVYIGDEKPGSAARKQKLEKGINDWKRNAIYTISFQNISFVIGSTPKKDENGNIVVEKDEKTGEETIVYDNAGLDILTFDYATTNSKIINNKSDNLAYFTISEENEKKLMDTLVENFGTEVTATDILDFKQLKDAILRDANSMNTKCDYDLYDFISSEWNNYEIGTAYIENLSKTKVAEIAKLFDNVNIEILPQKDPEGKLGFSAVDFFSKAEYATLSSSDMSIVATGLAAVVMETSLTVTVKNQGYITDSYYGYEDKTMTARVNIKDGTDLRIINPETHPYVITISEGPDGVDGKGSLLFKLEGCKLVNNYKCEKIVTEIPYSVVYDDKAVVFEYDPTNPNMGIDTEHDGGCYYLTYQEGRATYLYSFKKTITCVDGTIIETEVFPKQEFFVGQDEKRMWTKNGYNA
ncbi:MAG: hypothetical protein K6E87_04010 [bacterium]|nr:hypothetical protein [bacterium]